MENWSQALAAAQLASALVTLSNALRAVVSVLFRAKPCHGLLIIKGNELGMT